MPENDSRPLPRWGDTNSFAGPSDILRTRATSPRPLADYQPLLFPETDRHEPPPRQPAPVDEQTAEADGPPDNQQPDAQADRSTSLVTNIDSAVWPDYLDDPPLAMALMDRVVDGAIPLNIQGKSYRAHRAQRANLQRHICRCFACGSAGNQLDLWAAMLMIHHVGKTEDYLYYTMDPVEGRMGGAFSLSHPTRGRETAVTSHPTQEIFPMSAVPKQYLTPQEYLALERRAETKSEYLRGEMFAMAGASREHSLIAANVNRELGQQLRERPCEVYQADMRVKVSVTGLYTYPDVTVVCGEPQFEDAEVDTLLNPTVLIEVLSPSTADYDRGGKATHYRSLPSLQEYVLISQDRALVEHYARQGPDQWLLTERHSLDDTLVLKSINCRLPLTEIYLKVRFPAAEQGS